MLARLRCGECGAQDFSVAIVLCSHRLFLPLCRLVCLQYYDGTGPIHGRNVSFIISQVVQGLLANPKRRFTYVEQVRTRSWAMEKLMEWCFVHISPKSRQYC